MSRAVRSRVQNKNRAMAITPQGEAPPQASMALAGLPLLVKFLRKILLDCTLHELSARSGVHPHLISRYERGEVQPTSRNLDRLLRAAGVLEIQGPLLLAFDHLTTLLSPPPSGIALSDADPLLLGDLLHRTSRRLLLLQPHPDARLSSGEYSRPIRRDSASIALLVQFLRKILLGCTLRELSDRTGIHLNLLSRYERGGVRRPSSKNLDRLLLEARVLHLEDSLLLAMSELSALLARQPQPAKTIDLPESLLAPDEAGSFAAFTAELLRRTAEKLYPQSVPAQREDFLEE